MDNLEATEANAKRIGAEYSRAIQELDAARANYERLGVEYQRALTILAGARRVRARQSEGSE